MIMDPRYILNANINIFDLYEILHAIQTGPSGIGELVVKKDNDPTNSSLNNALEEFRSLREKQERFEQAITNGNLVLYPATNIQEEINFILDEKTTYAHLRTKSYVGNVLLGFELAKEYCTDYNRPALLVLVDLSALKKHIGDFTIEDIPRLNDTLISSVRLSEGIIEVLCVNYNRNTKKLKTSLIPLWM